MRITWGLVAALVACGAPSSTQRDDAAPGEAAECVDGQRRCTGNALEECQGGHYAHLAMCDVACTADRGCIVCTPGEATCVGQSERVCKEDGTGYEVRECDPIQGTTCNTAMGRCEGTCSSKELGRSYIGCEYFPTVTANWLNGVWDFGVIVSNTGTTTATVRLEGGTLGAPDTFTVAPNAVVVKRLAYDLDLKFCNASAGQMCVPPDPYGTMVAGGAFRLRSNQPITVYQFNPLDYKKGGFDGDEFSYSNDASLLLPTTALRTSYLAASSPTWTVPSDQTLFPGFVAITATQDDTQVEVTTSSEAAPMAFQPGVTKTMQLQRGDVLELASVGANADLTGTRVISSAPVQVIGGHYCTYLPHDQPACDHLEEAMFPVDALGTRYAVTSPRAASAPRLATLTRVLAMEPNTQLTYEPPIAGAPTTIAGKFIELPDPGFDFVVTGDKRISVVQYMQGTGAVGAGDPSMSQAVPIDQWRIRYLFHAPTTYAENYTTVVAPTGATVMLDGQAVTGWSALGATGYSIARVTLASTTGGHHDISSTVRFGITVYGFGDFTSYWYPGGLDLATIFL